MKTRVTIKNGINEGMMTLITPNGDGIAIDRYGVRSKGYAYALNISIQTLERLNENGWYNDAIGYAKWLSAQATRNEGGMYVSML